MSHLIQGIKGMHDALPERTPAWQHLEDTVRGVLTRYGYAEIRMPILEHTDVFQRSLGEATDIVGKEMYSFTDRNGDSLTLRPEGTAGCVRAALEHGLLQAGAPQRLWYQGPMFRHERPQKGRYRQFHQVGAEAFGMPGPDVDAELIAMSARLWKELGIGGVRLEINTLGSPASRARYREALVEYFTGHRDLLDEDSRDRLARNPLRILDSKNPDLQKLIKSAPAMEQHLDEASSTHFAGLKQILDSIGIKYAVNPRLVRGLDYYNGTVFEWISDELGAQGTICAGGRYDGLVELFGGKAVPGAGWAMGLERILDLAAKAADQPNTPHAYLVIVGNATEAYAMRAAESLRDALPGLRLVVHCGGGSFKSQFRKADKSGATVALIIGEDEVRNGSAGIKPLRGEHEQTSVPLAGLADALRRLLPLQGPAPV